MPKIIEVSLPPEEVKKRLREKGIKNKDIMKRLNRTKQQVSKALSSTGQPGLLELIIETFELIKKPPPEGKMEATFEGNELFNN